jgi:glycosyltransferase involved in cell wall biosynthesis
MLSVVLEGEFRSWASLAHINRHLGAELALAAELEFTGLDRAAPPDPQVPIAAPLAARLRTAAPAAVDIRVRHRWPPAFERGGATREIVCQPWEFGELPADWRDAIVAQVDGVWAYSRYVRDVYLRAGIDPDRVALVPPGIDPALFRPDGPKLELPARRFRFLFVGGSTPRKGVDLAINAFVNEFTRGDDVTLVIKDASALYPGNNLAGELARVAAHPGVAHVVVIDRMLPPAELAALYRSCDVLVAPYRGEGFGMPVLEAMACGLAVIVTAGGATDDFVDEAAGIRVPATRRAFPPEEGLALVGEGWLLEPGVAAIREAMRRLYSEHAQRTELGAAAAERAAGWTWERSAHAARAAFDALKRMEPRRR